MTGVVQIADFKASWILCYYFVRYLSAVRDIPINSARLHRWSCTLNKLASQTLVFFDGDCGFCYFWVRFIIRHDRAKFFLFAPLQLSWTQTVLGVRSQRKEFDTLYLLDGGHCFERSTAALRILLKLGVPWSLTAVFFLVPRCIRDFFYDVIARYRARLPFNKKACIIPDADLKQRILGEDFRHFI